jgi:HD-GYP domain-containing protein (c-di-GMP phosphodiesterase class II)
MSREPEDLHRPASQDPDFDEHTEDVLSEGADKAVVSYSARQIERVRDLLGRLYGARRAVRFYPEDHPAVEEAVEGLMKSIARYHDEGVDVPLTFFEGELLLGEHILPEDSLLFDQLIRDMTAIGAGSVTFRRGLDVAELLRAVLLLASDEARVAAAGGLGVLIRQAALEHVSIQAVTVVDETPKELDEESGRAAYGSAVDLLRDLEVALRRQHALPSGQTRSVVRSLVENVLANRFAMLELAGLKDYDEYTFYHSVNVSILSLALGSTITDDRRFLNSLGAGALMHDVGKMTVEGEILNKAGSLTPEEWAQMRLHPVRGAELVSTMPGVDKASVVVILEHHMRFDGKGYPAVRLHRGQHLSSRIVAVADAFDAMTSRRSYSGARLPDDAMGVLVENVGTAFDPRLVRLFIRIMGIFPPRSVVRLESGEFGIVVRSNESNPLNPVVRVISGPEGSVMDAFDVDLSTIEGSSRQIVSALDPLSLNVDVEDYM